MDRFNKKNLSTTKIFDKEKREKLFFHDIINQTHGLILFFNQRSVLKEVIKVDEVSMLEKEVRALQSLIKDHFEFSHKNLHETYQWVNFCVAEEALVSLIQTYLPLSRVKTFIQLKGDISYEENLEKRQSAIIYFPVFYRIMNNLIKNISEAQSTEVHFLFDYGPNGLLIETRNQVNAHKINSQGQTGLGLESIEYLTLECGGSFSVKENSKVWINRIFLPIKLNEAEKKAA